MYLIRNTFLRYKTDILYLAFNHAKKTVSKKEKLEFSAEQINRQNKINASQLTSKKNMK